MASAASAEPAAAGLGITHQRLPSGGGHDAMHFQLAGIPTGMVFAPSIDGISHSPEEDTPPEAVGDTARVLARAIATFE
jgi:acetylornithine deacetylase/succinyl-diaminopimelate desuccinylase-like protein